MKLYSVHDNKAQYYLAPQAYRNSGEALRAFESATKQQGSQFNSYPSDFTLLEIGSYDDQTAEIIPLEKPIILANGNDFTDNK